MKRWAPRRRLSFEYKNGKYQAKLLERHVVREIVERLWLQARIKMWVVRERIPGVGQPSTAGIPDLIGWIPGPKFSDQVQLAMPLFIEVKRPGGARRPAQEAFIAEARAGGCVAFFAESWDDVVKELSVVGVQLKEIR